MAKAACAFYGNMEELNTAVKKCMSAPTAQTVTAKNSVPGCFDRLKDFLANPKKESNYKDLSKMDLLELVTTYSCIRAADMTKKDKNFSMTIRYLKLLNACSDVPVMPKVVNEAFWVLFMDFLMKYDLSPSTIRLICTQLRTVLKWAGNHGVRLDICYDNIKLPGCYREQIALTPAEVAHIYYFDLKSLNRRKSYIKHLERVRDMFVLSCNLGQRWSDMIRIDKTCFKGNQFKIMQKKTEAVVCFNIDDYCLDRRITHEILEKYDYTAPCKTNLSNYDRYLKQLCGLLHHTYDDTVARQVKVNGEMIDGTLPKHKVIASHVARRTCATFNWYRYNRKEDVMKMTGHKTEAALKRYIIQDSSRD